MARRVPSITLCTLSLAGLLLAGGAAFGQATGMTYSYDFTAGTEGWSLGDRWTLGSWELGGPALIGSSNGAARHIEGTGVVRSVSLRFQMDQILAYYCLSLGDEHQPTSVAYSVCFEAIAVSVIRHQGDGDSELAVVPFSIEGGLPHSATVLTGGGSLDVFIDGAGVVGMDASDPSPGSIMVIAGAKQVLIDDVEIVLGGTGAPHARAPRPVADINPGPDVGPFVNGSVSGDLTLSGSQQLELSGGRYVVADGHIFVTENATLVIAEDGVLAFGAESSPLLHWGVHVSGNGRFEINGGRLESSGGGGLVVVDASEQATVELRSCRPWIHVLQAEGDSSVRLDGVRLVTDIGGQVSLAGNAVVDIKHSIVASISLNFPAGSTLRANGLVWGGHVVDFDLQRDLDIEGVGYQLKMADVALYPSLMTNGANEKNWLIAADRQATVELVDCELGKLNLGIPAGGDDITIRGLRLATPTDFTFSGIRFDDVRITQQWGFFVRGSRQIVFDDSQGVWLFVYDSVDAVIRRSEMSEFDPREFTGTVTFENANWSAAACEIIDGNDFVMRGSVTTSDSLRSCSWSESGVEREFDVILTDRTGAPVSGAELTVSRGETIYKVTTDQDGTAGVALAFDDDDRLSPWRITGPGDAEGLVDVFSSNPLRLRTSTSAPVRRGGTRVSP